MKLRFTDMGAIRAICDLATTRKGKVLLVKDDGIYLMAFAEKPAFNLVTYAIGHGKGTFVGGDDWSETFDPFDFTDMLDKNAEEIMVEVTKSSIRLCYMQRQAPASGAVTLTTPAQIEGAQLLIIRKRLELEIKFPNFAKGNAGAATMRAVKRLFPDVRTRQNALERINKLLAPFDATKEKAHG